MTMTYERESQNRIEEDFGDTQEKQKKEKIAKVCFLFGFKSSFCRYEGLFINQEINTITHFTFYL